jgi:hypothetical protein
VSGANTWDLWGALGTPPRTAIEIVVTAPLLPALRTELAPPAVKLELGVSKEQPGAIGAEAEPAEPAAPAALAEPSTAEAQPAGRKASTDGKRGKKTTKAEEETPGPELEARPGKRWTTFRVREQAVPGPSSD